jgi:hypothetical protein
MSTNTAQIKVYYDQVGNTRTVWFGSLQDEYVCEETGGQVIGFEKLNYSVPKPAHLQVAFETVTA